MQANKKKPTHRAQFLAGINQAAPCKSESNALSFFAVGHQRLSLVDRHRTRAALCVAQ